MVGGPPLNQSGPVPIRNLLFHFSINCLSLHILSSTISHCAKLIRDWVLQTQWLCNRIWAFGTWVQNHYKKSPFHRKNRDFWLMLELFGSFSRYFHQNYERPSNLVFWFQSGPSLKIEGDKQNSFFHLQRTCEIGGRAVVHMQRNIICIYSAFQPTPERGVWIQIPNIYL